MSAVITLALAPFAMLFRLAYAWPWTTVFGTGALGVLAIMTGHPHWAATLGCFAAYILIWMDETELRRQQAAAAAE